MPEELFEPMVIFFGLTNSPATFQAMMNNLLRDLVVEEKVVVFIDNVMVAIETEEDHDEIVDEVLKRLEGNDLFVKLEKCVWKVREVGFLGVIIGEDRVRMEKEKVQGVIEWLVPRSTKDVQNFLGLANYYRWFVKDFAKIAKLLHEITRKETKWSWGERQQKVFEELKERFTIEPVLVTCYMQVHLSRNHISVGISSLNHTSLPSMVATFLQHASQQWCIHLDILSSMTEVLLTDSIFYGRITSISVLTLKPLLRVIGAKLLKP